MWILPQQHSGFLNDTQKAEVNVLFNAILPGDAARGVPSAQDADAVHFLDLLLARDVSVFSDIAKWKTLYPKALTALNQQSQTLFGTALKDLNAGQATELLTKLETGALVNFTYESETLDQPGLFDTLRRHCIQGCFADMRWGGNKNGIMWKWYGYQEESKELRK